MEIKQHGSKWQIGYWRNQKWNKKISGNKWQWKHNNSELMGCSESSCKREIYSNTVLPQETRKKHRIDSITLHLKQLEKKKKKKKKIVEGKKS